MVVNKYNFMKKKVPQFSIILNEMTIALIS